jgi:hypothetical protein
MRVKFVIRCGVALGLLCWTAACHDLVYPPHDYAGPGCLLNIYPNPNLKGAPLPIRGDTALLADPWRHLANSVQVVYGSWRLYSEPEFEGFMGDYVAPTNVMQLAPDKHLGSLRCLEPAPDPSHHFLFLF